MNDINMKLWWLNVNEWCSNILDIEAWEISIVEINWCSLSTSSCSWFDPHWLSESSAWRNKEINCLKSVELLEVFCSSFAFECFNHDQILSVLKRSILNVLNGLEKWWNFPSHVSLLFCLCTRYNADYL